MPARKDGSQVPAISLLGSRQQVFSEQRSPQVPVHFNLVIAASKDDLQTKKLDALFITLFCTGKATVSVASRKVNGLQSVPLKYELFLFT